MRAACAPEIGPRRNSEAPENSEEALALDFADRYGDRLRYVAAWGRWMEWDGTRWRRDETRHYFDRARAVCRDAAAGAEKDGTAKALASASTVAAVERLAQADRRLAATTDQWDADPMLLNTPAGIIDLATGELGPHDPLRYCTKITAVAPAPEGAEAPLWWAFLDRVTAGNGDLQEYLQRLAGYTLTGSIEEHALAFLWGTGRNGKGVFIGTVAGILADYAAVASMETFTVSHSAQHPTDLAGLRGARLVTAQETEEGRRWAEAKIKALTGGDPIAARFMRQDFFTFTPQFTLIVAGNHKPGLRQVDEAIKARLHLVPFTQFIPPEERDPKLPEKLKAEWPAILRWMLDGCVAWREQGLNPPEIVRTATAEYLEHEDAFAQWLHECTEAVPGDRENTAALFASWKTWAERTGEFVGSQKRFSQTLADRGFIPKRESGTGKSGFADIHLIRTDYSDDPRYPT